MSYTRTLHADAVRPRSYLRCYGRSASEEGSCDWQQQMPLRQVEPLEQCLPRIPGAMPTSHYRFCVSVGFRWEGGTVQVVSCMHEFAES
jgi:hypothetical protein